MVTILVHTPTRGQRKGLPTRAGIFGSVTAGRKAMERSNIALGAELFSTGGALIAWKVGRAFLPPVDEPEA